MDMTPHFPIYMDYGATTPVDQRVVDAMIPWLREHFGNPASRSHAWGWEAEAAVERAREQVASLVGADPREIVWTSGKDGSRSSVNYLSGKVITSERVKGRLKASQEKRFAVPALAVLKGFDCDVYEDGGMP